MSAKLTSQKEISALLRLAAAALDDPDSLSPDEQQELVNSLERTANQIDQERGVAEAAK